MMVLPHSNRMEKKTATFVLAVAGLGGAGISTSSKPFTMSKSLLVASHQQRVVTVERLLPGL
jgi:hypothetical protein